MQTSKFRFQTNRNDKSVNDLSRNGTQNLVNTKIGQNDLGIKTSHTKAQDILPAISPNFGIAQKIRRKLESKILRAPVEISKSFTRLKANVTPNKKNPKLQKINEMPTIDNQVEINEKNADTSQPKEAIDINDQQKIKSLLDKYSKIYASKKSKPNETGSGFKSNSNSHVRATDTQLLIKRKSTLLKLLNAKNKSI